MEKKELTQLFERYLSGNITPEELQLLLLRFHQKEDSELLTELIIQEMAKPEETDEATLRMRQPMYARVEDSLRKRIAEEQEAPVIKIWQKRLFRIIAAAATVLFVSYLIILQWQQNKPNFITVNAPLGMTKQITLPDSSHVWLNAGSKIIYPAKFAGNQRQVTLKEGQAFFQVIHDAHLPFVIDVKGIKIAVLGTSFDVKAYANEKDLKITVATGKVGVNINGIKQNATYLEANQQGIVTAGTGNVKSISVDGDIAAWRENRLVFANENLDNIFHALERKFKVHFTIQQPKLLNEVTSMKLGNQPLSDVLTVLSFSKHFHYQFANDSTIMIK